MLGRASGRLSFQAGEFSETYGGVGGPYEGAFDAVVTSFFVDTAPNVVQVRAAGSCAGGTAGELVLACTYARWGSRLQQQQRSSSGRVCAAPSNTRNAASFCKGSSFPPKTRDSFRHTLFSVCLATWPTAVLSYPPPPQTMFSMLSSPDTNSTSRPSGER